MSNYYYFASDEEYQYALEHGWIKDTAKKVKGFVKTTASKITLNKKRKQIEKTAVKAGSDLSEARAEKLARGAAARSASRAAAGERNAKEIAKRQNRIEAIQKKVSPESNAKRQAYASKSISAEHERAVAKAHSTARGRDNEASTDKWQEMERRLQNLSDRQMRNSYHVSEEYANEKAYNQYGNKGARYVANYRSKHPGSKLSDTQILKYGGYI